MVPQSSALKGVVHGKTVELESDPGLPEGQHVTVTLLPLPLDQSHIPGEGLRRAFGAWAEDANALDEYLEWNRQQRKLGRLDLED